MRSVKPTTINTTRKVSKYEVFSGPYFPAFGLITERYEVSLRIQSECRKIQTRKNSVFGHFSRSGFLTKIRVKAPMKQNRYIVIGIDISDKNFFGTFKNFF